MSTNYVLRSPSWKKPWGVTNTSKKYLGFERGRCLPHLPPALRKRSWWQNEWTGCLQKPQPHDYGYMVTGSITTGSQNTAPRFVSQSALFYQSSSINTKAFTEKCEFTWSQSTSCYLSKYLIYEVTGILRQQLPRQEPIYSHRRTGYVLQSLRSCMPPQGSPTSL